MNATTPTTKTDDVSRTAANAEVNKAAGAADGWQELGNGNRVKYMPNARRLLLDIALDEQGKVSSTGKSILHGQVSAPPMMVGKEFGTIRINATVSQSLKDAPAALKLRAAKEMADREAEAAGGAGE